MSKPTYSELLRHPRWQQKRLEVIERAGRQCEECGATDCQFNAHHKYYLPDRLPWDYPDDCFVCLCFACHDHRHVILDKIKAVLGGYTVLELHHFLRNIKDYSAARNDAFDELEILPFGQLMDDFRKKILSGHYRRHKAGIYR